MRIFYSELRGQKAAENQSPNLKQINSCGTSVLVETLFRNHFECLNTAAW